MKSFSNILLLVLFHKVLTPCTKNPFSYCYVFREKRLNFETYFSIGSEASLAEERLLQELFDGYKKEARPVKIDNETVTVKLGLTVSQIIDVVSTNSVFLYKSLSHSA